MTIRRKLLLFIPLLVLLVNLVTFFLFQSGKIVQESYGVMMDRILLYNQSSQTADRYLQQLYGYLINPDAKGPLVLEQQRIELEGQRKLLSAKEPSPRALPR